MERIDLHEPIFEICRRLDLDPNLVRTIIFRAKESVAEVDVFLKNEDGKKYIAPDGWVATEWVTFNISHVPVNP